MCKYTFKKRAASYLVKLYKKLNSKGLVVADMQEAAKSDFPEQVLGILDPGSSGWEDEQWWPDIFSECPNLEYLEVSGFYTYIPKQIFSLKKLKLLEFSDTYVTCIPEEIIKLESLEYLDLSDSSVEKWPEALYLCKGIKHLLLNDSPAPIDLEKVALMPNLLSLQMSRHQIDDSQLKVFQKNCPDVELVFT